MSYLNTKLNVRPNNTNNGGLGYIILAIFIIFIFYIIIGVGSSTKEDNTNNTDTLKILSSSENKEFDSDLKKYINDNNLNISIDYADTLDITNKINTGSDYDAIWIANSIWTYQINTSTYKLTESKSTSINLIVFGIKKSKAEVKCTPYSRHK